MKDHIKQADVSLHNAYGIVYILQYHKGDSMHCIPHSNREKPKEAKTRKREKQKNSLDFCTCQKGPKT